MLEFGDAALALPKLYMVTIHELLGVFFGGVVVGADKLDGPHELAVNTDNASSILGHLTGPSQVEKRSLHILKFMTCLPGSRREHRLGVKK
jgi:hypothetical protein